MIIYDVGLYENTGMGANIISTFRGSAMSEAEARCACVNRARAAGRLTVEEAQAIKAKCRSARYYRSDVDTRRWSFTVQELKAQRV